MRFSKILLPFAFFAFACVPLFGQQTDSTTTSDSTNGIIKDTVPTVTKALNWSEINQELLIDAKRDENEVLVIRTNCSGKSVDGSFTLRINGSDYPVVFKDCAAEVPFEIGDGKLLLISTGSNYSDYQLVHISPQSSAGAAYRVRYIPLWLSATPPLVAIILALIFKEVLTSLFIGIWSGAFIANGLRFDPLGLILSFFDVVRHYILNALSDTGHLSVIIFSLMIGGMVAIISRNGGMAGVVQKLSRFAKTDKTAELVTWVLGVAIFFDDYANTLIVGKTMQPVTDKFKVSREKLSYIVDSTAAPVASIAFVTTWIGVELGYIKDSMKNLEGLTTVPSPYSVFLSSLEYAFYPIFTLVFMLMLILMRRDYGAMYAAEKRAKVTGAVSNTRSGNAVETEDLSPVKNAPLHWYNAFIPVLAVIVVTILGLVATGTKTCYAELVEVGYSGASTLGEVWGSLHLLSESTNFTFFEQMGLLIGNADSYVALVWASLSGLVLAIILTLRGRIMNLEDTMGTMLSGFKTMMSALMILALAWSLGTLTEELHTATFLTSALQNTLPPALMPPVIFILAATISFSTGSSWSTMAILFPIAIPSTWAIALANGYETTEALPLLYNVIATVLAASVFGDHCSPISDTTILSSLASDCNHLDHVRTQMPYAVTVGLVSLSVGYFATAFMLPAWLTFGVGLGVLFLIIRVLGKRID